MSSKKPTSFRCPTKDVERKLTEAIHQLIVNWVNPRKHVRAVFYLGASARVMTYDEVHNAIWIQSSDGRTYEVSVTEIVMRDIY